MQKLEEKALEEKLEELDSPLSAQDRSIVYPRLAASSCLAQRRPTKKPQDVLSTRPREN